METGRAPYEALEDGIYIQKHSRAGSSGAPGMSTGTLELSEACVYGALRDFIGQEVLDGDERGLDSDTPLLEWGVIDSLTMVNLLTFIEDCWGIRIADHDVKPERFSNLAAMTAFVLAQQRSDRGDRNDGSEPTLHEGQIRALEIYGIRRDWAEVGAARLHYLSVAGEGPAWVMLPALGNPATSWGNMLRTMADEKTAIALDLPGFGLSVADSEMPTFTDHLDLVEHALARIADRPVVLVGNSAGSMIAVELAKRMPERVHALVVTSFGAIADPVTWWAGVQELGSDPERFLREAYYHPPTLSSKLKRLLVETLSRPAYQSFLDDHALAAMPTLFDGLRVPVLFVSGQNDRIIPPAAVAAAHARVPGARLEWLARCGHFPHAERPQELLHLIQLFLDSIPRAHNRLGG